MRSAGFTGGRVRPGLALEPEQACLFTDFGEGDRPGVVRAFLDDPAKDLAEHAQLAHRTYPRIGPERLAGAGPPPLAHGATDPGFDGPLRLCATLTEKARDGQRRPVALEPSPVEERTGDVAPQ